MALSINISPDLDARTLRSLEYLGTVTSHANLGLALEAAALLTAEALYRYSQKCHIQILHQSIKSDRLGLPIMPTIILSDMRRDMDAAALIRKRALALSLKSLLAIEKVASTLDTRDLNEAVRFTIQFAEMVARGVREGPGLKRLAFVDSANDNAVTAIATPYDRTLRNDFSRLALGLKRYFSASRPENRDAPPPGRGPTP